MRLHEIKEHNPRILWVAKDWKKWLRDDGEITMYKTKKDCEFVNECKVVKIINFID